MSHLKNHLQIKVLRSESLADIERRNIISFCNRAYEEDTEPLFKTFMDATHVLGYLDGLFVSHAMWVSRYLQAGSNPILRTFLQNGVRVNCGKWTLRRRLQINRALVKERALSDLELRDRTLPSFSLQTAPTRQPLLMSTLETGLPVENSMPQYDLVDRLFHPRRKKLWNSIQLCENAG